MNRAAQVTKYHAINRLRLLIGACTLLLMAGTAFAQGQKSVDSANMTESSGMRVPPGYTGIGPVISGSVSFESVPQKARKFLQKYCDGHAVTKCEKQFMSGDYLVDLADGIEFEFDSKGNIVNVKAPEGYSLSPMLLHAVVPGKLYHLLVHHGFNESVEAVHRDNNGIRLKVADPVFHEVCYDSSGVLTLVVDR